ncbi:hypothetical protein DXG01_014898 [Tephrocybe rancida]|nr:hypothetical protein DXG01_014898 [Tephrocybe rancida]
MAYLGDFIGVWDRLWDSAGGSPSTPTPYELPIYTHRNVQLVRAILPLIPTPLHVQDVTLVANCVFQSVYISVSGFYPILTLSIINGPFSTNNVQEAVIESRAISLEIPQSA